AEPVRDEHQRKPAAAWRRVPTLDTRGIADLGDERPSSRLVDERPRRDAGVAVRARTGDVQGEDGQRGGGAHAGPLPCNGAPIQGLWTTARERTGGTSMVEKTITLTGTSTNSIEDAVGLAINRAATTIDGIRQAEVAGITALIEDGAVNAWKVRIRV